MKRRVAAAVTRQVEGTSALMAQLDLATAWTQRQLATAERGRRKAIEAALEEIDCVLKSFQAGFGIAACALRGNSATTSCLMNTLRSLAAMVVAADIHVAPTRSTVLTLPSATSALLACAAATVGCVHSCPVDSSLSAVTGAGCDWFIPGVSRDAEIYNHIDIVLVDTSGAPASFVCAADFEVRAARLEGGALDIQLSCIKPLGDGVHRIVYMVDEVSIPCFILEVRVCGVLMMPKRMVRRRCLPASLPASLPATLSGKLKLHSEAQSIAVSPDQAWLVAVDCDGRVSIYKLHPILSLVTVTASLCDAWVRSHDRAVMRHGFATDAAVVRPARIRFSLVHDACSKLVGAHSVLLCCTSRDCVEELSLDGTRLRTISTPQPIDVAAYADALLIAGTDGTVTQSCIKLHSSATAEFIARFAVAPRISSCICSMSITQDGSCVAVLPQGYLNDLDIDQHDYLTVVLCYSLEGMLLRVIRPSVQLSGLQQGLHVVCALVNRLVAIGCPNSNRIYIFTDTGELVCLIGSRVTLPGAGGVANISGSVCVGGTDMFVLDASVARCVRVLELGALSRK